MHWWAASGAGTHEEAARHVLVRRLVPMIRDADRAANRQSSSINSAAHSLSGGGSVVRSRLLQIVVRIALTEACTKERRAACIKRPVHRDSPLGPRSDGRIEAA